MCELSLAPTKTPVEVSLAPTKAPAEVAFPGNSWGRARARPGRRRCGDASTPPAGRKPRRRTPPRRRGLTTGHLPERPLPLGGFPYPKPLAGHGKASKQRGPLASDAALRLTRCFGKLLIKLRGNPYLLFRAFRLQSAALIRHEGETWRHRTLTTLMRIM